MRRNGPAEGAHVRRERAAGSAQASTEYQHAPALRTPEMMGQGVRTGGMHQGVLWGPVKRQAKVNSFFFVQAYGQYALKLKARVKP